MPIQWNTISLKKNNYLNIYYLNYLIIKLENNAGLVVLTWQVSGESPTGHGLLNSALEENTPKCMVSIFWIVELLVISNFHFIILYFFIFPQI